MSRVDQLIFTRVEPPYSPKRESGYQVVYRSNGITSVEVEEMRRAVEAFTITRGLETPPRWQYFMLSTHTIVIAQSHSIETDNDIMDRTGRKGIFLVHCYALSKQSIGNADSNPFAIFDGLRFATTTDDLRDLITRFGKATGVVEPQDVPLHTLPVRLPTHRWNADEFAKLVRLACDAGKIKATGKMVLMVGTQEEILEALRVALYYASNKFECTFNTNIDRMQTPPLGVYWAVGVSAMQTGPNFIQVNASERRVISVVDFSPPTDPYQIWFDEMTRRGRLYERDQYARIIQVLSEDFQRLSWSNSHIEMLDSHVEACQSFWQVHSDRILQRVSDAVMKHIPANRTLVNAILDFFSKPVNVSKTLSVAVPATISAADLIEIAFLLVENFRVENESFKEGDWHALYEFAMKNKNEPKSIELAFWSAAFLGKDGNKLRVRPLQLMQERHYEQVLKKLGNPFTPADFVTQSMPQKFLPILFHQFANMTITDEQFVSLIEAVQFAGLGNNLEHLPKSLFGRIDTLGAEHLKLIERSLSNTLISSMFTVRVEERRAQLPQPRNLYQRTVSIIRNTYTDMATKMPRIPINRRAYHEQPAIHGESISETSVQPDRRIPKAENQEKRKPEVPLSAAEPFQTAAHPARDEEATQQPSNRGVRAKDEQSVKADRAQDNSLQNNEP